MQQRVEIEKKKKYDFFISFNRNAFKPEFATHGEVFVFNLSNTKSKPLADRIQRTLVDIGFPNHGIKETNFYVLKNTKASALQLKISFIDNSADNKLFDAKFDAIVDEITKAITHGINKVETSPTCAAKIEKIRD